MNIVMGFLVFSTGLCQSVDYTARCRVAVHLTADSAYLYNYLAVQNVSRQFWPTRQTRMNTTSKLPPKWLKFRPRLQCTHHSDSILDAVPRVLQSFLVLPLKSQILFQARLSICRHLRNFCDSCQKISSSLPYLSSTLE